MNPLNAVLTTSAVDKKRVHDQAFSGSNSSTPCAKRAKVWPDVRHGLGCEAVVPPSPSNSNVISKEIDQELIDLCSESSGSYKTANDDGIPKPLFAGKYYSEISVGSSIQSSSNVLDLSTKRKKRFSTITLTSDEEESSPIQKAISNQSVKFDRKKPDSVSLNLQVVCLLGTGGYGKVFLVRTKENLDKYYEDNSDKRSESSTESGIHIEPERRVVRRGRGKGTVQYVRNNPGDHYQEEQNRSGSLNHYALKVIKKSAVLKSQTDLRHLKMEQRILARVQHPFIVECYMAVQTDKQLFFISEFIQGGELFNLLDRFAPLDESDSAFYMAEVLVAIEYLHSQGIIYRDLKPENIMLARDGHVKLVDFGLSRDDFPGSHSDIVIATKCGTKEYMAPEVYRKQPYGYAADWWSFGAVSFDLMTNKVPIIDQDYEKPIEFPVGMSRLAKDLLKRLMTLEHACRLGSVHGATAISRHPFFNGINWEGVEHKNLRPPFRLSGLPEAGDFSCFSRKVTSKRRRVCSESKKSFVDPQLQFHFDNFDYVHGCDLNRKTSNARSSK